MITTEINYFEDGHGKYYVNDNGDFYIASITYDGIPTKLNYIPYKPYIYNNEYKKYTAYIRKADGTFMKVKPYICSSISIAIAGLSPVG